jgi:uncharacterized protein (TIRG00374 family)
MGDGGGASSGRRWLLLSLAITVLLLAVLLSQTDLGAIVRSFRDFSPKAAVLGLVMWGLLNVLRAWRFQLLVHSRRVPLDRMFSIVNVQNLLATLTPGRAGEVSYVVLLRTDGRVPSAEGLAGLVVARAFDFVVASAITVASLWMVRELLPAQGTALVFTALALFGISIVALIGLAWLTSVGVRMLHRLIDGTRLGRIRMARRLAAKSEEVHADIVRMRARGTAGRMAVLTVAIWAASYAVSFIWIAGLGLPLGFRGTLFVAVVAGLAVSLPVQGIAGLGTTEAGWAIPLILLGIPREAAIAAGFCFHALAIVYLAALAALGFATLSGRGGRRTAKPTGR